MLKSSVLSFATLALLPMAASALTLATGAKTCDLGDTTISATACSGAWSGNDLNQDLTAALSALTGSNLYSFVGTSSTTTGIDSPFTNAFSSTGGTFTFSGMITESFVLALKAGNSFSLYYYEVPPGISELTFSTIGLELNNAGKPLGLSHASMYAAGGDITITVVPEPSTYAMMLAGVGVLGFLARRRMI